MLIENCHWGQTVPHGKPREEINNELGVSPDDDGYCIGLQAPSECPYNFFRASGDVINSFEVLRQERDEVKKGPEEGIYIYGLFLDCAKWEKAKDRLADSDPKVLFAPLPVLWITGCLSTASKSDKNMYYDAPLYKAPKRTGLNFISSVQLRTEEQPQKWTLRGVALLATIGLVAVCVVLFIVADPFNTIVLVGNGTDLA